MGATFEVIGREAQLFDVHFRVRVRTLYAFDFACPPTASGSLVNSLLLGPWGHARRVGPGLVVNDGGKGWLRRFAVALAVPLRGQRSPLSPLHSHIGGAVLRHTGEATKSQLAFACLIP